MAIDNHTDNNSTTPAESADESTQVVNVANATNKNETNTVVVLFQKNWKWLVPLAIVAVIAVLFVPIVPSNVPAASELKPLYGLEDATKFESPKALVDTASTDLGGQVSVATQSSSAGLDKDGRAVYKLPPYRVNDNNFKNLPTSGTGLAFSGDASQSEINYDKLVQFFTLNNFRQTTSVSDSTAHITEDKVVPFLSYAIYESKDLICAIWHADISKLSVASYLVSIGCAKQASYLEAAAAVAPYYAAYAKSSKDVGQDMIFGVPVVSDGTNGYKRATVYQESTNTTDKNTEGDAFVGLYYKASDSADWKYFGHESSASGKFIACTDYSTPELKKAFAGFDCYDTASRKNATVQ